MLQLHEESWVLNEKTNWGSYTKDEMDCATEACKEVGLPEELAYILYLAFDDINDLMLWAEDPTPVENTPDDADKAIQGDSNG